ncbi:MAG: hypothetical protein RID91_08340 [Azospirillaceae bacterium]
MVSKQGLELVSYFDCPGGGQVWVDGTTCYLGHMRNPYGTSIVDVADPRNPKLLATIEMPQGWHSHKVRVADGIMLVNRERLGGDPAPEVTGGLGIYDVSDPANPREITHWTTAGKGVHRYDFDGRYAYISPTCEGYVGNIVMILDLADPARPQEVGRWWIPGQWEAGGEDYPWGDWVPPRCHHPMRQGDRLYVSYWHHGLFILDISDMSKPTLVSALNTSPVYPHPTHTCLPFAEPLKGRKVMIVADEDVAKLWPSAPAFTWVYDITEERLPLPVATFQVDGLDPDGAPQPPMTGCHQPSERFEGTVVPFAWFAQGLRVVDFADPYRPREIAHYTPDPPEGFERLSSNDCTIDSRGLIYLLDRQRGLHIVEPR